MKGDAEVVELETWTSKGSGIAHSETWLVRTLDSERETSRCKENKIKCKV